MSENIVMEEITDNKRWNALIQKCSDFNFYQSYEWGEVKRLEGWNPVRWGIEAGNGIVLAQCLEKQKYGICLVWIPGGPLHAGRNAVAKLKRLLMDLSRHYKKKGIMTMLKMNSQSKVSPELLKVYDEEKFTEPRYKIATNLTFCADKIYLDNIENNLSPNWRRNLKRSFKNEFLIEIRNDSSNLDRIFELYKESNNLKNIYLTNSIQQLENIFKYFKGDMVTFLVYKGGQLFSGRITLLVGNRAFDFMAGTSLAGRKNYSSYFLVYKMFEWLAKNRIELFDFSGVDPLRAKGVYDFKKGTGCRLVEYIGEREKSFPFFFKYCFNLGLYFRNVKRI